MAWEEPKAEEAPPELTPRMVGVRLSSVHEIRERLQALMALDSELPQEKGKMLKDHVHRIGELLALRG